MNRILFLFCQTNTTQGEAECPAKCRTQVVYFIQNSTCIAQYETINLNISPNSLLV